MLTAHKEGLSGKATVDACMWYDFLRIARGYNLDTSVGEVLRDINRVCRIYNVPEIDFPAQEDFYI